MRKRLVVVSVIVVVIGCSIVLASGRALDEYEVLLCNPLIRQLEMSSTWEAARMVGVKGIEIHVENDLSCSRLFVGSDTPYSFKSADSARRIHSDASRHSLATPVVVAPIRLDPERVKKEGAPGWALRLIKVAPFAGVEVIYFPIVTDNFTKTTIADDEFVDASIRLLRDLAKLGKEEGIKIAFENLSVYWNRIEIERRVLSRFDHNELGICLDPINLYWYGHPRSKVYQIVRELIPRAVHFHAKNVAHPVSKREVKRTPGWKYGEDSVAIKQGDLDFERMIGELISSGYDGYISIEDDSLGHYETKAERLDVLRADVEYLRGIVGSYRSGTPAVELPGD